MKKIIFGVLVTAAAFMLFSTCDVFSPVDLDSKVFNNPVDPESDVYCGEESTDTDGDGIGDYMDADEIILVEPEDGVKLSDDTLTFSMKAKSSDVAASYGFIISENEALSDPVIEKSGLDSPTCTIETEIFTSFQTYFWAATVESVDGDEYVSDKRSFTISIPRTKETTFSGGWGHLLAITDSGTVKAWGRNNYGQVGDGSTEDKTTPQSISGLSDIIEVSAGNFHSMALEDDGTVWVWGYNSDGELGLGNTTSMSIPTQIETLSGIISISAGDGHSLALKEDGTVWAWGANESGQLGNDSTVNSNVPVQVLISNGETPLSNITEISCKGHFSVALKADGTVWAWGANDYGELGVDPETIDERDTAEQVSGLSGIASIWCGGVFTSDISVDLCSVYAIQSDKTIKSWGYNSFGQLGNSSVTDSYSYEPVDVQEISDAVFVSAGEGYFLVLTESGEVFSCGWNGHGQLGLGDTTDRTTPEKINDLQGVKAIGVGNLHSLALDGNDKLWAWGSNSYGLGDGITTSSAIPIEITDF